ncbi:hypothetical protein EVAR_33430_1 [Eumeta japonica]|uniref:Uncharacterized protein n=1 Tax=Eumeta variegata TaxID=151549 RepID=A0A4C1W372_EUMVA|nr:hypothetical protein EVAR_33430_1 [Eumeta japonica]
MRKPVSLFCFRSRGAARRGSVVYNFHGRATSTICEISYKPLYPPEARSALSQHHCDIASAIVRNFRDLRRSYADRSSDSELASARARALTDAGCDVDLC